MSRAAQHREALVRTAMRLFRRQGYASTGLQQILAESGAPKGSLYHYFPAGKEALGEAAVDMAGDLVADLLADLADKHAAPADFYAAYCRMMAKWMKESAFRSGCPIATTLLENAPQSPGITEAGARAFDRWIDIIADVLARDGRSAKDARSHAQTLIGAMEGALLLARVRRSTRPILDVAKLV
ncbi:MAG: TetR/AcrR family transcriptional regulator [Maricaulaceae bacterium]|jgi:TetR/AcrR family transcriptional repressor of lmrAB and yxaGH operons